MTDPIIAIHASKKALTQKFKNEGLWTKVSTISVEFNKLHYLVHVEQELDAAEKAKIGDTHEGYPIEYVVEPMINIDPHAPLPSIK